MARDLFGPKALSEPRLAYFLFKFKFFIFPDMTFYKYTFDNTSSTRKYHLEGK